MMKALWKRDGALRSWDHAGQTASASQIDAV